ncbi:MAG: hypothetical protein ABIR53_00270, partial [Paraperlucidibaca sp.]
PTFGQLLGNRADEYRDLKKSWQAGTALKSDGAKDIEKGEDLIKRGEKLIKQGESLVTQGKANVQQGSEEVDRAEANYIKMIATPAVPSAL